MRLFLSYNFADEPFIRLINYHLRKQETLEPYCYGDESHRDNFIAEIGEQLERSDAFLFFQGSKIGHTQEEEAKAAIKYKLKLRAAGADYKLMLIELPEPQQLPSSLALFDAAKITAKDATEQTAGTCARKISESLLGKWVRPDDLPIGYPFDYEKTIIDEYSNGDLDKKFIELGCPPDWPRVTKKDGDIENCVPESEIGLYRDWDHQSNEPRTEDPQVIVAALTDFHTDRLITRKLTFPEAGPRKYLHYPSRTGNPFTVGIMVSGGIAPGINAVISGIAERHFLYADKGNYTRRLRVLGYQNGLSALFRSGDHYHQLQADEVKKNADLAGSMLGTSRAHDLTVDDAEKMDRALDKAVHRLAGNGTKILYLIGGDGSMRAAHALWKKARDMGNELSVVAIPKTMDNDVLWVWQSFGFLSAVQWSKEAIQQLHTEAVSNPRLCVIQLFGSDSGFVVTHAVTASGVCDLFLIPEVPFSMQAVSSYIIGVLKERYDGSNQESAHCMVVMAETAIPQDAEDFMEEDYVGLTDEEKKEIRAFFDSRREFGEPRVFGQTPDALRSGGLKLVSRVLQERIREQGGEYWREFRVFTNEPRHLIRSISPSSSDIIFGRRLGSLAVDCAMAGYTDFMISQWLTEYVMVPLKLVTLGRKRIPKGGIFYKSARSTTGQPAELV